MLHKTLAAETTVTDTEQGTFTALASAWDADREKDVIEKTAFDETIRAWATSGKRLRLLLEHTTTVVGAIDPPRCTHPMRGLSLLARSIAIPRRDGEPGR